MTEKIKLLDCTLRDGGHNIDSCFGEKVIKGLIDKLVKARVDIIELGFLRTNEYNPDIAVFNDIGQAKKLIGNYSAEYSEFALLAQEDQYDASLLPENDGLINFIRVSFHINDANEGIDFCKAVKQKGYKVYCNPINIKGYTDSELLELISKVNVLEPDTFTIVDTFGSLQCDDLKRIVYILLNNLNCNINIAVHLHENMSQSFSLAQEILKMNLRGRDLTIDGSLRGMGRIPGNLPIELIADYLNKYYDKSFDMDYIFDAIENHINYFFDLIGWGYDPIYSLAAQYNLHRTYAEFLKSTGKLGTKDIKMILSQISDEKKVLYDRDYIENLYCQYLDVQVNDTTIINKLRKNIKNRNVLVLANGSSIKSEKDKIDNFLKNNPDCIIISVHFFPEEWAANYSFFSNLRRYANCLDKKPEMTILTSNVERVAVGTEMVINYKDFCVQNTRVDIQDNSMLMILNLLVKLGSDKIFLAGFDGYKHNGHDYYSNFYDIMTQPEDINNKIQEVLKRNFDLTGKIQFITKTIYYQEEEKNVSI